MANEKTYYQILGVIPDAEDIVIKAAYKALSQRYHPDKFKGSAEEAEAKMKEINFAYSILSDKGKRKVYDGELKTKGKNREYYEDSDFYADGEESKEQQIEKTVQDEEWELACEYYPRLDSAYKSLRIISHELANCFKIWLLIRKDFEQMEILSRTMKQNFMELRFGTNPQILSFAEEYIERGRKDVLRELNKAVVILGPEIDPFIILNKIINKFGLINEWVRSEHFSSENKSMHLDNLYNSENRSTHLDNLYKLKSSLEFHRTIKSAEGSLSYLGYNIDFGKKYSGPYQIENGEFLKTFEAVEFESVEEVVEFTEEKLERMILNISKN